MEVELSGDEKQYISSRATNVFDAYDLFLRGQELYLQGTRASISAAQQNYRAAINLDPSFARAYGALGVAIIRDVSRGWSDRPLEMRDRALDLVTKAASLDPLSHQVQWSLGFVRLARGEHDEALPA